MRNLYSKSELEHLYIKDKLSSRQIAKKLNVYKVTILYWLRKFNIPIRSSKNFKWEIIGVNPPTKKELEDDYRLLSLDLIAKKYNISVESVLKLFKDYNLKKRTRSEARKLAVQTKRSIPWNKGLTMEDSKVREMVNHLNKMHLAKINESKIKQAETRKKLFAEGKLEPWNKGKKLFPEHIEKIRETKKKISNTPEFRAKMREIGMKAKPKYKNTKPEKMMKQILEQANLTNGLVE